MAAPTLSLPPDGVLSRADFDALPDAPEGWAWELHDGTLELKPMPVTYWHAEVIRLLLAYWIALGRRGAGEQRIADSGYVVGGKTQNNRVADGIVFIDGYVPPGRSATHSADLIDLVIEAVSSRSEERDSVEKMALYASLGIPKYWIVRESPSEDVEGVVSMYALTDGSYELTGSRLVTEF